MVLWYGDESSDFKDPKDYIEYHANDRVWADSTCIFFITLIYRVNIVLFTILSDESSQHVMNSVELMKEKLTGIEINHEQISYDLTDITKTYYIYQHCWGLPLDNVCSGITETQHYIGLKVTHDVGRDRYGNNRRVFKFPWKYKFQTGVLDKGFLSYTSAVITQLKRIRKESNIPPYEGNETLLSNNSYGKNNNVLAETLPKEKSNVYYMDSEPNIQQQNQVQSDLKCYSGDHKSFMCNVMNSLDDISLSSGLNTNLITNPSMPISVISKNNVDNFNIEKDKVMRHLHDTKDMCMDYQEIAMENGCSNGIEEFNVNSKNSLSVGSKRSSNDNKLGMLVVVDSSKDMFDVLSNDDLMDGVETTISKSIVQKRHKGMSRNYPIVLSGNSSMENKSYVHADHTSDVMNDQINIKKFIHDWDEYCLSLNIGFIEGSGRCTIKWHSNRVQTELPIKVFEMSFNRNIRIIGDIKLQYRTNEKKMLEPEVHERKKIKRTKNKINKKNSERMCKQFFSHTSIYNNLKELKSKVKFIDTGSNYKIFEGNVLCIGDDKSDYPWRIASLGTDVDLFVKTNFIIDMIESSLSNRDLVQIEIGRAHFSEKGKKGSYIPSKKSIV